MSGGKRILLGRITAAHGIRGEVQVAYYTGEPEAIGTYGPLSDESGKRSFVLRVVRVTPKGVIARIDGVADRTAAEKLRGIDLYVDRSRLPPPGEGEFYHEDLIGLAVVSPDGTPIGSIVAVANYGAGDLLEVRLDGGKRTEFVPFKDAFVPTVDLASGRAVVIMPEFAPDDGSDQEGEDDGEVGEGEPEAKGGRAKR